jgi:acetyl-CoA acetyltransferase
LFSAYNTIRSGVFDLGIAIGFDKHERGAFRVDTRGAGLGNWYGASGLALTTQFFGMKINRYMHEYGISHSTLGKVSEKAFRNGSMNPMAWRRKPISEQEALDSLMLSYPLTQYMFCSPGEGGVALILARADKAHLYTDKPIFVVVASEVSKCWHRLSLLSTMLGRPLTRQRPLLKWLASDQKTSTLHSYKTPRLVPKSCIWPKTDSVNMVNKSS